MVLWLIEVGLRSLSTPLHSTGSNDPPSPLLNGLVLLHKEVSIHLHFL